MKKWIRLTGIILWAYITYQTIQDHTYPSPWFIPTMAILCTINLATATINDFLDTKPTPTIEEKIGDHIYRRTN